ncbi:MAG: hypothetical protein HC815_39175 [Richelia sp. RM1_1_1]|nr:hypothetical protein [Richelia sp. SM1_7_0]NJN13598.1 hypothetical protein [Richelia sp. RM1_1_1]
MIEKIEKQLKVQLEFWLECGSRLIDDIFGYPWGGILLCSIVWLMVGLCLVQAGVANGI